MEAVEDLVVAHGIASARRYVADQDGMRAIGAAVAKLEADPYQPEGFHRGEYHQLRVGRCRVFYFIDDEWITIERVDRVISG